MPRSQVAVVLCARLQYAKLGECNAVAIPLKAQAKFINEEGSSRVNSTTYRSLIGSLRYLPHTRLDLLFSVRVLSKYMENPN